MFWYFVEQVCRILAPQPGIKPKDPELEGEVLDTGPPGKSLLHWHFNKEFHFQIWNASVC